MLHRFHSSGVAASIALIASCFIFLLATDANAQGGDRSLGFLVTGKSTEGVDKEVIAQKQKAHIDNFKRLAGENLLFMAGPMADPEKYLRGIVMVAGHDRSTIDTYFEPDPYVSEGFMKLEIHPIAEMDGETSLNVEPNAMEELRIAIWQRDDPTKLSGKGTLPQGETESSIREKIEKEHLQYWKGLRDAGKVALRLRFVVGSNRYGMVLLKSGDDEGNKAILDKDPMVRDHWLKYQIMPQYLGKGAVRFK